MTKDNSTGLVELIRSTNTRVCCLNEDLVVLEFTLDGVRDNLSLGGSSEDPVRDHCCDAMYVGL